MGWKAESFELILRESGKFESISGLSKSCTCSRFWIGFRCSRSVGQDSHPVAAELHELQSPRCLCACRVATFVRAGSFGDCSCSCSLVRSTHQGMYFSQLGAGMTDKENHSGAWEAPWNDISCIKLSASV